MVKPPIPSNEAARLARLRDLMVLDSAPEPVFDSLTRLASEVCGAPIALISLVDAERQWFKANTGLPGVNETPRDVAFCAYTVTGDSVFEVGDATRDARFSGNPLVTGAPDIRFYAGAPLVLDGDVRIGSLCVIDRQERSLDATQKAMLQSLANVASQALVMRRDLIERSLSVRSDFEKALALSESRFRAIVEDQSEMVSQSRPGGELVYVNPAYARQFGLQPAQMVGANLFDFVAPADREAVRGRLDAVLGSGEPFLGENRMAADDGSERWVAWSNTLQRDVHGQPLVHSVGRDVTDRRLAEEALRSSQAFLQRTGRVAGVGGWEVDLRQNVVTWSEQTRRIHEVEPGYVPTVEAGIRFYAPEARSQIEAAVQAGMERAEPWDLELPFVTATGRAIWVRAAGEAEFENGVPVRLVGAFQDITERRQLQQRLTDSERFVRQITDSLPVRIAYVDKDARYRFVNLAHCRRFGRERDDILGRTRAELLPGGNAAVEASMRAALAGTAQQFEFEETVNGALRRIESHLLPDIGERGEVRGFFSTGVDITERSAAERALRDLSTSLRSITEAIPAIVAVVDADQRYRFVNSAFERWIGRTRDEVVGRTVAEVIGPVDYGRSLPAIRRALAGESVSFERDADGRSGMSHLAVSYIPMHLDGGAVNGFVGVAQDISQHKREEVRLLSLAQRDALTGLLNRAGFEQALDLCLADGGGAQLAVLYVDLDRFKPVNDTHGHAVGDQVLKMFAQRLSALVRPTDAIARLGGDEFALVLSGVREPQYAGMVADKVVAAAGELFDIGSLRVGIGASVGVAYGAAGDIGWKDLVERADRLLYQAKQQGRGRRAGGDGRADNPR